MKKTENGEYVLTEEELNRVAETGYAKGVEEILKGIQKYINDCVEMIEKAKK